jgi:hypothetical protein
MTSTWEKYMDWVGAHEKLLIVSLLVGLSVHGINKMSDKSVYEAKAAAELAKATQSSADAQLKQLQATIAQQQTQYEAERAADNARITALTQAIVQRDAAAQNKVTEIQQDTTPLVVAQDFGNAYGIDMAGTPVTNNGQLSLTVDEVKMATIAKINGDACTSDLADTKSQLTISQTTAAAAQTMVTSLQGEIAQDKTVLAAHDADAAKQITSLKKQARRSKLHWFEAGFVTGVAATITAILH